MSVCCSLLQVVKYFHQLYAWQVLSLITLACWDCCLQDAIDTRSALVKALACYFGMWCRMRCKGHFCAGMQCQSSLGCVCFARHAFQAQGNIFAQVRSWWSIPTCCTPSIMACTASKHWQELAIALRSCLTFKH